MINLCRSISIVLITIGFIGMFTKYFTFSQYIISISVGLVTILVTEFIVSNVTSKLAFYNDFLLIIEKSVDKILSTVNKEK